MDMTVAARLALDTVPSEDRAMYAEWARDMALADGKKRVGKDHVVAALMLASEEFLPDVSELRDLV